MCSRTTAIFQRRFGVRKMGYTADRRIKGAPIGENTRPQNKSFEFSFENVELVPQFQGNNRGEVKAKVQRFLENKLGKPADYGEV
ncbi:hypothetical protein J7T55_002198 [Diaporthe amygdali]|uniref:uncharacterized protein n=1 Tax=Phomopsis amygdali TaxID=1214568 RepID=UPI0022FE6A65|nr:uncharacterized protein J7T55_002198 [Diaporthe amygdali]KAJ0103779.1 hypothetical protein J7T55_002198 [Diaporthe amygdali]